jgi:hypothetical protein
MEKKAHLIFSIVMSLFMISIMSFVVTYLNIGRGGIPPVSQAGYRT